MSQKSSSFIHVREKKPIALIHVREKKPIALIHGREKKSWHSSMGGKVGGRRTMRGTPGREPHMPYQIPNIPYQIWNTMSF